MCSKCCSLAKQTLTQKTERHSHNSVNSLESHKNKDDHRKKKHLVTRSEQPPAAAAVANNRNKQKKITFISTLPWNWTRD